MWGVKTPVTPCTDCSGIIIATGNKVTRFALGDRVAATFHRGWLFGRAFPSSVAQFSQAGAHEHGVLTRHAIFSQEHLVAVPDYLSFEEASTLPCAGLTAWSSLFGGSETLKPGNVVLIQGSGGVSLFAAQFARVAGARVIATTSKPDSDRGQRLLALGVSDVVSYMDAGWGQQVKRLTRGRGVDFIVETSGSGHEDRDAIAVGGHIAVVGGEGASGKNSFDMRTTLANVRKVTVGSRELFEEMMRAMETCEIRPVLDSKIFTFAEAEAAFRYAAQGSNWGKIVIKIA